MILNLDCVGNHVRIEFSFGYDVRLFEHRYSLFLAQTGFVSRT